MSLVLVTPILCGLFGKKLPASPPPPPPAFELRAIMIAGGSVGLVFCLAMGIAYYYVASRWRKWLAAATSTAFKKTDIDDSGSIDRTELYTGVLEMYLQLHLYGVRVRPPNREGVLKIVDTIDTNHDNHLDQDEFERVLAILLQQTLSRFLTQITLTVLCPFTSSYVCYGVKSLLIQLVLPLRLPMPPALASLCEVLPSTLDETIVTGMMMLSIAPAQGYVDQRAEAAAERASASARAAAQKGN